MVDLSVEIGNLHLKNPIMPASGTFGPELSNVMDINLLGALVAKSITRDFQPGNPTPRVAETDSGMLNSIGIPSKGIEEFLKTTVREYSNFKSPVVASISAHSEAEFAYMTNALSIEQISAIELNISCPNLEAGGKSFALDSNLTEKVVKVAKNNSKKPIWVKLSPNVTDISEIAIAAENGGADALVVANTLLGMAVDSENFRAVLGTTTGGLSGRAVKPIILRMVKECYHSISIPVIGCGGISNATDVVEFMLVGASAVQVGTVTFEHPAAMETIINDLPIWCKRKNIKRIADVIGAITFPDREISGVMEGIR
ncbi:MAG: dihydroorotate dehydrogenase B catalytic subunit [Rhodospirillaceae bacterium]|nr:dihydroorotate dehydrogenase B catalytic subunit [Rhodospirillaceae bacterium]